MKNRLLWKLLLTNAFPVIGVIFLIVWLAIDKLAARYFMALMEAYNIPTEETHRMFLTSIHQYLWWAGAVALGLAVILSYLLTRKVLKPLSEMTNITREIAAGNFSLRAKISTGDEVGELGIAFNRMADSLEKIELLRKKMVADVAHELRTPLTNLRGYLEALNDQVIPPTPELFQMLQQENLRLVHLVDNLQQLSRADAAKVFLALENVTLSELILQVLDLFSLHFQKKNIEVKTEFTEHDATVNADRDKLLQAIRNLVENCWKYTPDGGEVIISTQTLSSGLKANFQNTGTEISDNDLPYIFERFFRVDRSRSRDWGGAGIGLAITKELIEAHGGDVGATSTEGQTNIWFTLPR
ncbi:sensor histidine kinase [Desulfomarina sp.]